MPPLGVGNPRGRRIEAVRRCLLGHRAPTDTRPAPPAAPAPPELGVPVLDLVFLLVMLAVIAVVALVAEGVERL
jgi:hypothetical protein